MPMFNIGMGLVRFTYRYTSTLLKSVHKYRASYFIITSTWCLVEKWTSLITTMINIPIMYPAQIQGYKSQILQTFENYTNNFSRHGKSNRTSNYHYTESKNTFNFKHFFWGLIGLIIISYFIFDIDNEHTTYFTNEGYYGSAYKPTLNKFLRYISDEEDLLAKQQILNGSVFNVPKDREVILIESDFGLVKIRFKNESYEFWTLLETIKE